jgi:hypothetical protein
MLPAILSRVDALDPLPDQEADVQFALRLARDKAPEPLRRATRIARKVRSPHEWAAFGGVYTALVSARVPAMPGR